MNALLIFLCGGIGSLLRYLIGLWTPPSTFPWATLIINVGGCLIIGLFSGGCERFGWTEPTRLALTVGLCGGFTTFSTFSKEAFLLLHAGRCGLFAAYTFGSLLLGLIAVAIGTLLTRQ